MSYISELKKFYPKSCKARFAINAYNVHKYFEHEDPTVVTVHETYLRYGGPEEGGWDWIQGYPILTHCIFSKKQAIQTYIHYFEEYEIEEQASLSISTTFSNYDICFGSDYAKLYPTERPRYC
jgi:hypothetical protein